MFCPGCGSGASDGDAFCRSCGRRLDERSPLKVVTGSPLPARVRRRVLPIALRAVSIVGLVTSGIGTWSLLHADAAPVRPQPSSVAEPPPAGPSPTGSALPAASPTASPVPTSPPEEWADWPTCTNAAFDYQISYPPGWYTPQPDDQLGCRFFDPSTFTVKTDSPLPDASIRIYISDTRFAKADRIYRTTSGPWVIRRSAVHVEGHRAFMVQVRTSTGKAFATFIDMDGASLVIDTYSDYDRDFLSATSYVMLMSGSLEFSPAGSP